MEAYFSVILPVYNVASYLERCIQSVLDQPFEDYEMILVDDGSTDESPRICDEYAARYDRIRVIHKENGGLASARNAGAQAARGQYIWWVDSDDWIEPDALSILYQASRAEKPDMVKFSYYRVEDAPKEVTCNARPGMYEAEAMQELMDKAFYSAGRFSLSACFHIYRRAFLEEHPSPFVSERIVGSEDYLFNLSVYPHAQKVLVLPQALYDYEMRQGSLTQRYKKNLPERYEELYTQLCHTYQKAGILQQYEERICFFYIWHLLRGTCIPNEYYVSPDHSQAEGRKKIRAFLRAPKARQAMRRVNRKRLSMRERVFISALYHGVEPLFYWLYVVKPGLKRGT